MIESEIKMKPCPFCGNDDPERFSFFEEKKGFSDRDITVYSARVYCSGPKKGYNTCGCTGPWSGQEYDQNKARNKAIDAWERRDGNND